MPIPPAWQTENRPPRVLLVDDDREILEAVHYAMASQGFEVHVAHDGNQGIAMAETVLPDLMIVDMMMPKRSGFLVLERLSHSMPRPMRMIMVTANDGARHQEYARLMGVSDYIHKPFAMDKLMAAAQLALNESFPDP